MKMRFTNLLALVLITAMASMSAMAADSTVRVGVLKFGTVNWELTTMQHHGLDKANGFDLEIVPFAGGDATRIALLGGEVDVIVSDWLWVSRQRAEGSDVTFVPYSSSVGAIMVPGDSALKSLGDLKGQKIGVAGGPLDKSWLLLQGMARQEHDIDLANDNEIVFGAPPLTANSMLYSTTGISVLDSKPMDSARWSVQKMPPMRWVPVVLSRPSAMYLPIAGQRVTRRQPSSRHHVKPSRSCLTRMRNGNDWQRVATSRMAPLHWSHCVIVFAKVYPLAVMPTR